MSRYIDIEEAVKLIMSSDMLTDVQQSECINCLNKCSTAVNFEGIVQQLKDDSYEETQDDMNAFDAPLVVNLESAIKIVEARGI